MARDAGSGPVCRSCGAALEPGDHYCPKCGRSRRTGHGTTSRLDTVAQRVQDLLYGVLGWCFVLLTLAPILLVANSIREGSVAGVLVGLVLTVFLAGFGVVLNPRFGRQIVRRHSLGTFGRTRTVDHRVIPPEERCLEECVVCGEGVDVGLVRRRRDETVVAGLPVWAHEIAYNHYCADCAETHVLGSREVDRDAVGSAGYSESVDAGDASYSHDREEREPERAQ